MEKCNMACAKCFEHLVDLFFEFFSRLRASDAIPFGFKNTLQFDAIEHRIVESFCKRASYAIENGDPLFFGEFNHGLVPRACTSEFPPSPTRIKPAQRAGGASVPNLLMSWSFASRSATAL